MPLEPMFPELLPVVARQDHQRVIVEVGVLQKREETPDVGVQVTNLGRVQRANPVPLGWSRNEEPLRDQLLPLERIPEPPAVESRTDTDEAA